jgi:hypothetical protein
MAQKRKKSNPRLKIALGLIVALVVFILYVFIFSLIKVDETSHLLLKQLVDGALSIKNAMIVDQPFYSLIILILVSILVPVYLKLKK